MKKKYFLRGLGLGIVITALLLCIFYRKQMNDDYIIDQAKILGMSFPEDGTITGSGLSVQTVTPAATVVTTPTPKPTLEPTPIITEGPTPTMATNTPVVTILPTATKEVPVATAVPTTKPTVAPTSKPVTNNKKVTLTIKSGMLSSTVAKELQKLGVIKNAKDFDQYLMTNGYADKITVGKYKINADSGYKTIAQIITK